MEKEERNEDVKAISVRLPIDLLEQARDKSKETGVSISFVVRKSLEEWVKKKD